MEESPAFSVRPNGQASTSTNGFKSGGLSPMRSDASSASRAGGAERGGIISATMSNFSAASNMLQFGGKGGKMEATINRVAQVEESVASLKSTMSILQAQASSFGAGDAKEALKQLRRQLALVHWTLELHRGEDHTKLEARFIELAKDVSRKADREPFDERLQQAEDRANKHFDRAIQPLETMAAQALSRVEELSKHLLNDKIELKLEMAHKADESSLQRLRRDLDITNSLKLDVTQHQELIEEVNQKAANDHVDRSVQSLQALHQRLSMEVGKKAGLEDLERKLQFLKEGLTKDLESKSDAVDVFSRLSALGELIERQSSEMMADTNKRIDMLVGSQQQLDGELKLKLESKDFNLSLEDLRHKLISQMTTDGDSMSLQLETVASCLGQQVHGKADIDTVQQRLTAFQTELSEHVELKADHVDVNDKLTLLQWAQQGLVQKQQAHEQDIQERLNGIQQVFEETLARAVNDMRPVRLSTGPAYADAKLGRRRREAA